MHSNAFDAIHPEAEMSIYRVHDAALKSGPSRLNSDPVGDSFGIVEVGAEPDAFIRADGGCIRVLDIQSDGLNSHLS
jgi:hypothetical protein